jgi:glycosyltransferase involved in cell wall biosynthesis
MPEKPVLAIVTPCFNEEAIIAQSIQRLNEKRMELIEAGMIATDSYILIVDDGSTDGTRNCCKPFLEKGIRYIRLSRNYGHQAALLAGMHKATNACDCMISIDSDLQDDPDAMLPMLQQYAKGYSIVFGVRDNREVDSWFKRNTALLFYRLMKLLNVPLIHNHADYRLISNPVLLAFQEYTETNLFLRGIFPQMGFKATTVPYRRLARSSGESHYSLRKMISLALTGLISNTSLPLKWITGIGFILFFATLIMSGWVLVSYLKGETLPGWASITLPIYFIGGIQLLSLGIIGQYISKIFIETKRRPPYHIEEISSPDN